MRFCKRRECGSNPVQLRFSERDTQQEKLPIGYALKNEDSYSNSWSYAIVPERLIAYKHGKINEVQVQSIEKNLETIISEFTSMKKDLSFLLRGDK